MIRRFVLVLAAIGVCIAAGSPARADWRRAESPRFIVYSSGPEGALRDYVQKLESYDRALRLQMGADPDAATVRKLPIYLLPNRESLKVLRPDMQRDVAGFYTASEEDIYAVADVSGAGDFVLLHEYAHHFMLQNFAGGYPGWFVEGFADYYATADISGDRVMLGRASEWRVRSLQGGARTPLDQLLSKSPTEITDWRERPAYYPTAWLLTHYFFSDDTRRDQLSAYLADVGRGGNPVEAMPRATGMSLEDLDRALTRHLNSRMPYFRLGADFPRQQISVERLGPSADALLLINQRLKSPIDEEDRPAVVAEIRELARPFGDDPLALVAVGHAELHFGDRAAGEASLRRLLETDPDNVEALQLLASGRIMAAREDGADVDAMMAEAQTYLMRAFRADPSDFTTLVLGLQTRVDAPGYPTPGDLGTWVQAYRLAPQLASVRIGAGQALLFRDRDAEGLALLSAVASNPHGGASAEYARKMIEDAKAGVEVTDPTAAEGLNDDEPETPQPGE
ncbi:MAG: hypothetical protein EON90_14575 [Brevundimonas sp.]|nr:MAG: hypothetical protein EON90_14575 [Brevundimonas sp.]